MKRTRKNITIFFLCALLLFPLLFLCMLAFGADWRFPSVLPGKMTFDNLHFLFSKGSLIQASFVNSVLISLSVSAISTTSGFFISKIITFHRKRSLLLFCAYLPFVISPVIYAACLNYYFIVTGLSGSVAGVILAQFIITFPYAIILFSSHWNQQLKSMQDLTLTLGGSISQSYFKVLIPASKNILLIAFFQTFLISWFEFGLTNLIGEGKVQTLTVRVYQYVTDANLYLAALCGLLLVVPPLILLWINKKFVFKQYQA